MALITTNINLTISSSLRFKAVCNDCTIIYQNDKEDLAALNNASLTFLSLTLPYAKDPKWEKNDDEENYIDTQLLKP